MKELQLKYYIENGDDLYEEIQNTEGMIEKTTIQRKKEAELYKLREL